MIRRSVAVLMLVLHLGGCATWQPVTVSPRQFIEEERPDHIRVWRDERPTQVRSPRIEGDILTSTIPYEPPVGIALTDITAIESRHFSIGRSGLLVAGTAAGIYVVLYTLFSLANLDVTVNPLQP